MKTFLYFLLSVLKTQVFLFSAVIAIIGSVYVTGYTLSLIFHPENREIIAILSIVAGTGTGAGIIKAYIEREMGK